MHLWQLSTSAINQAINHMRNRLLLLLTRIFEIFLRNHNIVAFSSSLRYPAISLKKLIRIRFSRKNEFPHETIFFALHRENSFLSRLFLSW